MNTASLPVVTSAAQAAVVAGLAVDTAGLTPGGGGVAVVRSGGFVQVVHDGQVGGRGVGGGTLQQDDSVKPCITGELLQVITIAASFITSCCFLRRCNCETVIFSRATAGEPEWTFLWTS